MPPPPPPPDDSDGASPPPASTPPPPPPYAIVTGANAGLGKEIALGLMKRGHHVVLACRRMDACEVAAEELRRRVVAEGGEGSGAVGSISGGGTCACAKLDVSDFASVRAFARQQRLDLAEVDEKDQRGTGSASTTTAPSAPRLRRRRPLVLCNNAGVMGLPLSGAVDPHLQTNHYGPYLLTRLLMPELRARPGSRLVMVASRAHYGAAQPATSSSPPGRLGDGPEADARMSWFQRYCRSKLLNVQTAASAHARLAPHGSAAFSVSPGFVATNIFQSLPAWLRGPAGKMASLVARTPEQGARVAVFAATDEGAMREAIESVVIGGGGGVGDGGAGGSSSNSSPPPASSLSERVRRACEQDAWLFVHDSKPMRASAPARDPVAAEQVWRVSALVTGLEDEEDEG